MVAHIGGRQRLKPARDNKQRDALRWQIYGESITIESDIAEPRDDIRRCQLPALRRTAMSEVAEIQRHRGIIGEILIEHDHGQSAILAAFGGEGSDIVRIRDGCGHGYVAEG